MLREELCLLSGVQLPDGQLVRDLLNTLGFELEVTHRLFRDDAALNLHHVQQEVTDEFNTIKNR
jgi:hypothetical protein